MFRYVLHQPVRSNTASILRHSTRRRLQSSNLDKSNPGASHKARPRVDRILSRLPRSLQRYAAPLVNAPLTHISAFLLLHEFTAVVPLLGLTAVFHYTQWMPPYVSEGKWVSDGVELFGNYFRKKGWLGHDQTLRHKWWGKGEGGLKVVIEFATAYAITKALLPVRLVFSVWATPWFARAAIVPLTNVSRRMFRKNSNAASGAAGTGATGGRVDATGLYHKTK